MLSKSKILIFRKITKFVINNKIAWDITIQRLKNTLYHRSMIKVIYKNKSSKTLIEICKSWTTHIFLMRVLGYLPIQTHQSLVILKTNKKLKNKYLKQIAKMISPLESCHLWLNKVTIPKINQQQPTLLKACTWVTPKGKRKTKINNQSKSWFFYKTIKSRKKTNSMSKAISYHLRTVAEIHLTIKSLIDYTKPIQHLSRTKEPRR